jgi:hypothetical protein
MERTTRLFIQLGVSLLVLAVPMLAQPCAVITPEPATFWLIGGGAAVILVLRRMRSKK